MNAPAINWGEVVFTEDAMGKFFKGWKRKTGCCSLVVALALCGLWVRSLTNRDQCVPYPAHNPDTRFYFIQSERSTLGLVKIQSPVPFDLAPLRFWSSNRFKPSYPSNLDQFTKARWSFCGVEFRGGTMGGETTMTAFLLHYWSIVVPLTLISAWCLLTKSRSKPTTTSH
jgi:hypothetical protein